MNKYIPKYVPKKKEIPSSVFLSNDDLKCTQVCFSYLVGCKNKECKYAHNVDEIRPHMCKYKNYCKNQKCEFFHSNQQLPDKKILFQKAIEGKEFKQPKNKVREFIIKIQDDILEEWDENNEQDFESCSDLEEIFTKIKNSHDPEDELMKNFIDEECNKILNKLEAMKIKNEEKKKITLDVELSSSELEQVLKYLQKKNANPIIKNF